MTGTKTTNDAGNALSIAGLVIGIVALLFSFIPCLGMYAAFPGGVAVILSGLGLYFNIKSSSPLGLSIVALCIALSATSLATFQYFTLNHFFSDINNSNNNSYSTAIQQQLDSLKQNDPEIMLDINEKIDSFNTIQEVIDTVE